MGCKKQGAKSHCYLAKVLFQKPYLVPVSGLVQEYKSG